MTLGLIRYFTRSEYAHVGVAWRLEGQLFVVEATSPVVRISPVRDDENFYWIPTGVGLSDDAKAFITETIGLRYSLLDAIRAYMGWTVERDGSWQCVELAQEIYSLCELDIKSRLVPSDFVKAVAENRDSSVFSVKALK
jgi:hypothetical protein